MADEMQQQQQQQQQPADALKQLLLTKLGPEAAAEYTDDELAKLLAAGYKGVRQLTLASRESLLAAGVKPALVDELVHAFAAAAAAPPVEITDGRLEEAMLRALKRTRSDKVSISNFTARAWGHMSSRSGLKMEVCLPSLLVNIEDDTAAAKLDHFHWHPDQPEPAQADRYMQHLQQLIRLPGRTDYPLLWHQAGDRNKHLLNLAGFEDRLYYSNITGNTDAAIVTRVNYLAHIVRGGLCVLFELKKMVDEASVYQAVCELVVASILSTQWKPVVVLTDLIEDWQLFWLNGATVKHVRCPSRATAVVVIKGCVDQAATAASGKELPVQQQLAPQLVLPAVLADRKVPDLAHSVQNAAGAAVNPDLLDLADMLPAEEMQDVYARVLLQQVSRLPVFSTTEFKVAAASMYS